jgi:hypothetical protein
MLERQADDLIAELRKITALLQSINDAIGYGLDANTEAIKGLEHSVRNLPETIDVMVNGKK